MASAPGKVLLPAEDQLPDKTQLSTERARKSVPTSVSKEVRSLRGTSGYYVWDGGVDGSMKEPHLSRSGVLRIKFRVQVCCIH